MRDPLIQSVKCHDVIVVEGKKDTANLKKYLDCETLEVNGYAVTVAISDIEARAANEDMVVFTDSDRSGRDIRKYIHDRVEGLKDAELKIPEGRTRSVVEKAKEAEILQALHEARARLTYELRVLNNEFPEGIIPPDALPLDTSDPDFKESAAA